MTRGLTGPGSGRPIQRGRRYRPADRHPLEHPRSDVRGPLPHEVPRHIGEPPVGVGEVRGDARALHQPHERQGQGREEQRGNEGEHRGLRARQRPGDLTEVVEGGDVVPTEDQGDARGHDDSDHEPRRAEPGAFQHDDQGDRGHPHRQGRQVQLARVDQRLHGTGDPVRSRCGVSGEVRQLTQDDVDPDGVDEPHHHCVRHEPQHRAEPEEPGHQHHHTGHHREGEQCPRRIARFMDGRDIRHDHRHRTSALDGHER